MKHERVTEDIEERAALFALGSLSQHEALAFERHLREGCAACQQALDRHEGVVALLGLAAPRRQPAGHVRDLLVARLERERDAGPRNPPPQQTPEPSPVGPATPVRPRPARSLLEPPSPPPARPGPGAFLPWVAAVIAIVAATALYQSAQDARDQLAAERKRVEAERQRSEELMVRVEAERQHAEQLEDFRAALAQPGVRLIILAGQMPAPKAFAHIYWDTTRSQWKVAAHLPPPPGGKTYQLWFVTPQAKRSAGLLAPDASGRAFAVVDVPADVGKVAAAAITLEPEGGSAQPTSAIYVLGKV